MTRNDKLIEAVRNNPRNVRFDDACKIAERLGFVGKGGKGSHAAFSRPQAKQLIAMIDKYGAEL